MTEDEDFLRNTKKLQRVWELMFIPEPGIRSR